MLNQRLWSNVLAGPSWLDLQNRMRSLISNGIWTNEWDDTSAATSVGHWTPYVDVVEGDDHYMLVAELPGIRRDDVTVAVENNVLTIRGEKPQVDERDTTVHRSERSFGAFERKFTLPATVDVESIDASFDHGLLTIRLTKIETTRARRIPVG